CLATSWLICAGDWPSPSQAAADAIGPSGPTAPRRSAARNPFLSIRILLLYRQSAPRPTGASIPKSEDRRIYPIPRIPAMPVAKARSLLSRTVRESRVVPEGSRGLVLVSGGPDSAATAAGLTEWLGAGAVSGLHLDYGLRPDSGEDERVARELCGELGIELRAERPELDRGNLQAAARNARYAAAERIRGEL